MSAPQDLPLGAIAPPIAVSLAKAHCEHLAEWLGHAECFANPEEHAKHFRACWRRVLWLRRSLDRLARHLDRENRPVYRLFTTHSTRPRPGLPPGGRSWRGAAAGVSSASVEPANPPKPAADLAVISKPARSAVKG